MSLQQVQKKLSRHEFLCHDKHFHLQHLYYAAIEFSMVRHDFFGSSATLSRHNYFFFVTKDFLFWSLTLDELLLRHKILVATDLTWLILVLF